MDLQKFINANFANREASVAVPALAEFFPDGCDPVWTVRGLTAAEMARANEAISSHAAIKKVVEAIAAGADKAKTVMDTLGLTGDEVPADISRRIEMLAAGSVWPALGADHRDVAVRLAESFPVVFFELTNKILELTGQGAEVGKRKPSGSSRTSASP